VVRPFFVEWIDWGKRIQGQLRDSSQHEQNRHNGMNTRYQAKEPLASGGRGAVLRGWDSQLGREVAIKRVRRDVEGHNGSMIEDLMREAMTLSTVQHPNVVTVYDVGSDDEGAFIVMELVKGETLETIVERGALTEGDFRSLVEQTLDGLLAAHQVGVIHLDLKPQNLMLTWLPGGGFQVKILDFGLAMATRQPVEPEMDDEGAIFGSIYFMAPEQFERVPVDVRTDLYALGCTFYFALTQRYPFDGELGLQVLTSHLQHHRVELGRLRLDLPAFVTGWVEWLMSRQPEDRPESCGVALMAFRNQRMPEKVARVE
jgi:serine/threonine protein kinase